MSRDVEPSAERDTGGHGIDEARRRPAGLVVTRTTPTWTLATAPPALLSSHHTSAWAELRVSQGMVQFTEDEGWSATARPGHPVTIVPGRGHAIAPSDDAVFHVTFFGPPAEARR